MYPAYYDIGSAQPVGFSPAYGPGYSYSVATNDTWMKGLHQSGIVTQNIVDPINDNSHYFIYIAYGEGGVGSCTKPVYMLMAYGWEGGISTMPPDSRGLNCSKAGIVTAGWGINNTKQFSQISTTLLEASSGFNHTIK